MAYNFQSPFAQALINEGRSRGASPFAIAASLGNGAIENGLNTNGTPGDNGSAFGGFQWRNERKQALDALAQKMGKPWDDPTVQAKHWWDEQNGSESRWGLNGAGDIDSANRAAISSLRPAGWTADNPAAGHAFGDRLRASQEALNYLNGGGGGNPADMPVQGAQNASFQVPNGVNPPPKEGLEGFLDGGPGALFGKPQEGWNIGDALSGAGIAMMARDNPSGASALASYINGARKADAEKFKTAYDYRSGKLIKIDGKGNVTTQQINDPQKNLSTTFTKDGKAVTVDGDTGHIVNSEQAFTPEAKPVPAGAVKLLEDNRKNADVALKAAEDNQKYINMFQNGDIDLSAADRVGANFSQFLGDSNPKVRNYAMFLQHMENLRNARLLEAKGVQTEGDAVRAMETLLPGASKYDSKSVVQLLGNLSNDFMATAKRSSAQYDNLANNYKTYDPDNLYKQEREPRLKAYDERQKAIEERMPAFLQAGTPTATTPQAPVTGQNPGRQAQPSSADQPIPRDAPRQPNESFEAYFKRKRGG